MGSQSLPKSRRPRPSSGHSGRRASSSFSRNPSNQPSSHPSRAAHERQASASSDDGALVMLSLASSRGPLSRPERASTLPSPLMTAMEDGHITLSPSVSSLPRALVILGLECAGVSAQRALMHVLSDHRLELDKETYDREGSPIGECGTWNLPSDFIMVYVCPSKETARPDIHTGLVRFRH
jgi:hypothetical protein